MKFITTYIDGIMFNLSEVVCIFKITQFCTDPPLGFRSDKKYEHGVHIAVKAGRKSRVHPLFTVSDFSEMYWKMILKLHVGETSEQYDMESYQEQFVVAVSNALIRKIHSGCVIIDLFDIVMRCSTINGMDVWPQNEKADMTCKDASDSEREYFE